MKMSHELGLPSIIFCVYIIYLALNVFCTVLLIRGENYPLVWITLVIVSSLHLVSLLSGACQEHALYPFASDTNGFLVAIYLLFDLALCVTLGVNVLQMIQDNDESSANLVVLLCASTITNVLWFYKFYYTQNHTEPGRVEPGPLKPGTIAYALHSIVSESNLGAATPTKAKSSKNCCRANEENQQLFSKI